jgi:hypothetical protein
LNHSSRDGEIAELREEVAELSKELAFAKGLVHGSSGAGRRGFFAVRGEWRKGERYDRLDVVERGHAWYVAKRDDPRSIPGDGEDWQAGPVGKPGERGLAGPRGLKGDAGKDAFTWVGVKVDRGAYTLTAVMSDGSEGPAISLRPLFEQYDGEHLCAVETLVARALQTPMTWWAPKWD